MMARSKVLYFLDCMMDENPGLHALAVAQQFKKGDRVRLSGLEDKTILNGAEGKIKSGPGEEGRYTIKIRSPPAAVEAFPEGCRVKPSNMELVHPEKHQERQQQQQQKASQPAGQTSPGSSGSPGASKDYALKGEPLRLMFSQRTVNMLRGALDNDQYPAEEVSRRSCWCSAADGAEQLQGMLISDCWSARWHASYHTMASSMLTGRQPLPMTVSCCGSSS
jgi:hypothetical protein